MTERLKEPGSFIVEGPGALRRPLRCLYLYDRPLIFTFPHEGKERLFTCCDETDEASIFYGATPGAGLVDRLVANAEPLIRGYQTGPFYKMVWPHVSPWPTEIVRMVAFPANMLPHPDVYLTFDPEYDLRTDVATV